MRHQPTAITLRCSVHRAEQRHLGVLSSVDRTARYDPCVKISGGPGGDHIAIPGHGRKDARLQLGGIRDHQLPAVVRHRRGSNLLRQLKRPAATGRPPTGHDPADDVVGAETTIRDPRVDPVPAVRARQPRELFVFEERRDGRMLDLLQLPRPGTGREHPAPRQPFEQFGRRIWIQVRHVQKLPRLAQQGIDLRGSLPRLGPRTEEFGQQLLVYIRTPWHSREPHLGRDQCAGRLSGE